MYTREVNGKELELGVSGKLYKDALVMFDRETGTLWTQVDGQALKGPLLGQRLVEIPALQTTWKTWKDLHPQTLVLRKPDTMRNTSYGDYFADPEKRGLFDTRGDKRLGGKTMIVGIRSGGEAVAIPLDKLQKQRIVEAALAGEPVVFVYSPKQDTTAVFRSKVDGRPLTFRLYTRDKQMYLQDTETATLWSPMDGRAVEGLLKDKSLAAVPYLQSYWYAWSAYLPQTRILP